MVHGEAEADQAQAAAKAVFGGSGEGVPTVEITKEDGNDILSLLVKSGLCASKSDARRNVQQGGVTANDSKVTDIAKTSGCPLARVMRKELRGRGIHHLKVAFSPEQPGQTQQLETPPPGRRSVPASVSWVPPVAGLLMAGTVVQDLLNGGGLIP